MNLNEHLGLNGKRIILASGSPRRSSLLEQIGLKFEIKASEVNEDEEIFAIPEVQVLELSRKKAMKIFEEENAAGFIIGADTVVVHKNEVLGKPRNAKDARKMLQRLSGKQHTVYTGFSIVEKPTSRIHSDYEKTYVTFRQLDDSEIDSYIKTDSPLDKAGAYGIQDQGALFVERVDGCFYNVMGFPLAKFYEAFRSFCKTETV